MKIKLLIILIATAAAIATFFMFKPETASHQNLEQNYEERSQNLDEDMQDRNEEEANGEGQIENQQENEQEVSSEQGSAVNSEAQEQENLPGNNPPADQNTEPESSQKESSYPIHRNITATVFWVGEPQGGGSSEDNAISAWDDNWQQSYGGFDDPENRDGYYPVGFTPKETPFYLDLPYNDFNDNGDRKSNAFDVVPWANQKTWSNNESFMKNRWVKLAKDGKVCYGQIEDAGPYEYDGVDYVFGSAKPKNHLANSAGLDVSPALRDCLDFEGINNADNRVDWQFVEFSDVPSGPWKEIITTSQI